MFRGIALRFGLPLLLVLGGGTYLAVPFVEQMLTEWFRSDIELRARLVKRSIEDSLEPMLAKPSAQRIRSYLTRVANGERLIAIVVCGENGRALYASERVPKQIECRPAARVDIYEITDSQGGRLHTAQFPLEQPVGGAASVLIVHDLSFVESRSSRARDYLVAFLGVAGILIIALCVLIAWLVFRGWVRLLVKDIRNRRFMGEAAGSQVSGSVIGQVRQVLKEIEQTQRQEIDFRENWTADALHHVVKEHLEGAQLIVVSNREPYIHNHADGKITVQYPASGMVTALEPVIRACSGVWIAHGSGTADKDVVDLHDRVQVPPNGPAYTLRRVWLSAEEEEGYYYGFSNEGLWPLCHLAFVRPTFRAEDWAQYRVANERFARAVEREAKGERPLVLLQDYHFALLPSLVRERLPHATIALFWHIPWPNPAAFGICPWRKELLQAMLQADVLGFHTRFHCQNFLATVDRYIECHIDHEHSTVTIQDHVCHVEPYPISIEWPPRWIEHLPAPVECRRRVFEVYGIQESSLLGVGVERWDFTKGIVDRFLSVERLLELEPAWRGKLVFLQIAAPTRSKLPAYQDLQRATQEVADRVNARFGTDRYRPIILVGEHRNPEQVYELFRASDFCIVNSLEDGMNLVAKEFVASREDEDGVLVLSTFAGASRELVEAILVNPFDIEGTARAISQALRVPREERRERMRLMRRTVQENNVFRWAGRMLMDAARIRQRQKLALMSRSEPGKKPRPRLSGQ